MGQGDSAGALACIEKVLEFRDNGGELNTPDAGPIPVYMDCYRVLESCTDRRALLLIEEAHRLLHEQAMRIENESMRRTFLHNKRENRELNEIYEKLKGYRVGSGP